MTDAATFKIGEGYETRSVADYDTIWRFWVVARTKSFVTFKCADRTYRVGVRHDEQGEWVMPLGRFSMAPVLRAATDKIQTTNQGATA